MNREELINDLAFELLDPENRYKDFNGVKPFDVFSEFITNDDDVLNLAISLAAPSPDMGQVILMSNELGELMFEEAERIATEIVIAQEPKVIATEDEI